MVEDMSKAVELKNFSYSYPDGTAALKNITLSIEHSQRVALIGPNGAGKSTILLSMAGFIRGEGEAFVDGIRVNKKNLKRVRSLISCCFENPDEQLFMPRLFDDVAFGPLNMGLGAEEVRVRVEDALKTVGLEELGDKAPHHLSAGQKRAAAIATVLSMSPKIITLDEPDGSLDPRNRGRLVDLLKRLPQTVIVATCNMNFAAEVADRVVLVDEGCIVADGAAEILWDSALMKEHGLEVPRVMKEEKIG